MPILYKVIIPALCLGLNDNYNKGLFTPMTNSTFISEVLFVCLKNYGICMVLFWGGQVPPTILHIYFYYLESSFESPKGP